MYALITGASRGIGLATAKEFAAHGYNIIAICHKNINDLSPLVDEILRQGGHCLPFSCDLSEPKEVFALWDAISDLNINIDVLINNAGISHIGLLQDMSNDEWMNIINTNLSSIFYMCKAVIPGMINRQRGHIVNISSVWGNVGASCEVAYSASKGGVNSFTKALAKELAPSDISVNAVAFGTIDTDMNKFLSSDDRLSLIKDIPAGRMGTTTEAGKIIYDIATTSNYLTGQVITVDGGWC